jgi:hypothetical protein
VTIEQTLDVSFFKILNETVFGVFKGAVVVKRRGVFVLFGLHSAQVKECTEVDGVFFAIRGQFD